MSQAKSQNITSRRALLAGAPAAAAGALAAGTAVNAVAVAMARAGEIDPIFGAIAAYKEAVRAREAALERDDDKDRKGFDGEWEAFYEMLDTTPTTIAGVVAMLEVLGTSPYADADEEGDNISVAGWAYNDAGGDECPVDQLLLAMAATLRASSGGTSCA
jgi:hypothetical protein